MAALDLLIAWHVVLGVALAIAVWAVGLGGLRVLGVANDLLAYPVGLALVLLAAFFFLARWWLFPLSLMLVMGPLARAPRRGREPLVRLARAAPGAVGLGVVLGLLLHGPTGSLRSHAYGDLTFFAARQVSAAHSVLPFRDYLVEGLHATYVESAPALLGGALSRVLPIDPFLFQTSALPAFAFAATAIGFGLGRLGAARSGGWSALLLAAAVIYPTWLTESPPVALALPLAFAMYELWRDRIEVGPFLVLVVALAWDLVLTKGLALSVLAAVVVLAVIRHNRRLFSGHDAALVAVVVVAIGAAAVVLVQTTAGWLTSLLALKFLPRAAYEGIRAQFTVRSVQELAPALEIVGEALLFAALARARLLLPLVVSALAIVATWFVGGHAQDIALSFAILLSVIAFVDEPAASRRTYPWAAGAAGALAAMAWVRDPASLRPAFVALAFACLAAAGALGAARRTIFVAAVACVAGIAVVAAKGLTGARVTLTSDAHDVWHVVHERVPANGLVFTSLTGSQIAGEEGWNYYPGVARRQVYIAGWADSPLRLEPAELRRRLAANSGVLHGSLAPKEVRVSGRYESFYAVVRRSDPMSRSFQRVYENRTYVLYRLQ